jgi:hypothetical protein
MVCIALNYVKHVADFFGKTVDRVEDNKVVKVKLPTISDEEWITVRKVGEFLAPFKWATIAVCKSHQPTVHLVVSEMHDLHSHISQHAFQDNANSAAASVTADLNEARDAGHRGAPPVDVPDDVSEEGEDIDEDMELLKDAATRVHEKFNKYYLDHTIVMKVAMILDPTIKLHAMKHSSADTATEWETLFVDLYRKYYSHLQFDSQGYLMTPFLTGGVLFAFPSSQPPPAAAPSPVSGGSVSASTVRSGPTPIRPAAAMGGFRESYKKQKIAVDTSNPEAQLLQEVKKYLAEEPVDIDVEDEYTLSSEDRKGEREFDILGWWRKNARRFPRVALMARHFLGVPATSVASESAFSTAGRVVTDYRSRLAPQTIEALLLSQSWLRDDKRYKWDFPHSFHYQKIRKERADIRFAARQQAAKK